MTRSTIRPLRAAALAALVPLALAGCSTTRQAAPGRAPSTALPTAAAGSGSPVAGTDARFRRLESAHRARLGVYAIDTGSHRTVSWRGGERFPYASTYKAVLVGLVLRTPSVRLDRVVHYDRSQLVDYSPDTGKHVADGMSVRALCVAAIRDSDNTAANLLTDQLGGVRAFAGRLPGLGDRVTRPVRTETSLNTAVPGDARDTSTPRTLATDLAGLAVGGLLPPDRRRLLDGWLRGSTTGTGLVRAGVPDGWTVGDKSGTGAYGTRNDVAVVWPPHRAPIVLAVFGTRQAKGATPDDSLVAAAAKAVVAALCPHAG
ncbi:beta-lactamase [Actinocatenispora thailandica]|uniref:Beta-lactamase n=1 Tax=Actinocatenispora thailandica TaxID=227318 RepID=A0A7R7DQ59_9ACTN|nr:class A beta-lactamase [Actinocatenispora thailandica]BCJ35696.1 beta-lactamase [Actinocatenispora thailandica]